ncbi:HAMP domain-containing histidine kinase [Viridibacillus sp. YIM B01967]|uniref:histidine kinase n=1 Tax=Viridibacillus soli TaxID=2798301 RepID=A0ABS1H3B0_9BACL|nr:HAMP domain-containing sensor histidine kinase [Viridibacillus soli]MBK3493898.1 HAMP domain-containing histidine kinase [Viridibacillus soli]
MGKLKRLSTQTLRGQIISSFYLVFILSIIATIITWVFIVILLLSLNNKIHPANYYEGKIPKLVKKIQEKGDIIDKANKETLNALIPLEGIDYQVIDRKGQIMYGSMSQSYISSETNLIKKLNINLFDEDQIIKYYPIFDDRENLLGAIGFRYKLSVMSSNPNDSLLLWFIYISAFCVPFFYFHLISYLVGKRFSERIERPFNEIIEGTHKIEKHDLDFSLAHINSTKELNQLVFAFEEMKEALKESLQKQWDMERERKELIAAVAHDLKTPLTIIQGHAEGLLEMEYYNIERQDQYLKTIMTSCHRSIKLINELNEISKVEQPEFKLDIKETDVNNYVSSKLREYTLLSEKKDITLKTALKNLQTDEHPLFIDVFRINQVLDNIFANSLRYTPVEGVISWETIITNDEIIFEITDNGKGFSGQNTTKIFEKFYRENTVKFSEDGHSGLGLFIAQTIVKKHNGEILAKNRIEGGAYFRIVIKNMIDGQ